MTKVAITTVNYNGKQDTLDWLASLKKLDARGLEVKIFVVSNEEINTPEYMKKSSLEKKTSFLISVEVILKKENRGSAGGYNDGAKAALAWGADYILLINNDTLIKSSDLLTSLIHCASSDPRIAAVSPKIYFAPGFEFHKERYSKQDIGKVIWYAGGSFDWANINSTHRGLDEVDTGKYDSVEETGFVSGSCMLVKRAVFDQGIFWDEGLFAYFDDNDFQEKMKRADFKIYYDGKTSIFHKVSQTSGVASPITDYYTSRNRLIFTMRYAPLRTKFAVLRQELGWLATGRSMQKRGVIDFFLGKRGELDRQTVS